MKNDLQRFSCISFLFKPRMLFKPPCIIIQSTSEVNIHDDIQRGPQNIDYGNV